MAASCFFCQNLLSDYIEGILPSTRHDEVKGHLVDCKTCTEIHKDLTTTLEVLGALPSRPVSPELALRLSEASQAGQSSMLRRISRSRSLLYIGAPAAALLLFSVLFPDRSPVRLLSSAANEAYLVRYYPLMHGADEVLEDHGNLLHAREPTGSLWEEGGLAPDEFERAFQVKGGASERREEFSEP